MRQKRVLYITTLIFILFFLTGCWDSVEIQKRTMILSVAVDKAKSDNPNDRYEMTIQIAEPTTLSEKSIPGKETVWNLSSNCPSLFECVRNNATEVARPGYYGHLQIILIGEELAEKGIADVLDLFFRDHEMRRKTKLVIVKGKAKDALKIDHPLLPISGQYISDLTQEALEKTGLIPITFTVGQFSSSYQSDSDLLLPMIKTQKNHVDMSGAAIIKDGKLVDFIQGDEVKLYRVVMGTFQKGAFLASSPSKEDEEGSSSTFEIKGLRTTIHPSVENEIPQFKLKVLMEGHIAEDGIKGTVSEEKLQEIEKEISEKIKSDTLKFTKKMQEEYQADIFNFGEKLRRYEYDYWKKVEGNWDEVFAKALIEIEVTTYIRRYGRIKQ